jgi:hypothetical protein
LVAIVAEREWLWWTLDVIIWLLRREGEYLIRKWKCNQYYEKLIWLILGKFRTEMENISQWGDNSVVPTIIQGPYGPRNLTSSA